MPGSDRKAPYAYAGLDRVFHEKARLGIATSLAGHADGLGFSDLKALCGLTDGNLSRHLQVLEEAGFVALDKGYAGKRPHTHCRLTDFGREQFMTYLAELEHVLRQAARATAGHSVGDLKTRPQAG
jgi:DNA-binding HxlR family transcriptional regulator